MGATLEWRTRALAEIERRGRGAHAACAKAVKCSKPTLTQLLNGGIDVSPLVPLVSKHLGIPKPGEVFQAEDEVELLGDYKQLGDAAKEQIRALTKLLVANANDHR